MIRPLLLMMCLLLCGCMSAEQVQMMQEQAREQARINTDIQNAVTQQPNLMGRSAQQIEQQFGNTSEVSTTYNAAGTQLDEKYSYIDASNTKYSFDVSIINGVVTSVQYFPPFVIPVPPPPPAPDADQPAPNPPDNGQPNYQPVPVVPVPQVTVVNTPSPQQPDPGLAQYNQAMAQAAQANQQHQEVMQQAVNAGVVTQQQVNSWNKANKSQ